MSVKQIDRRTLLHGLGGAALALPALDIMRGKKAMASGRAPLRFVLGYAGVSIGNASAQNGPWEIVTPKRTGKDYDLTRGLKCLGTPEFAGVRNDMGIITGLRIPVGGQIGSPSNVPKGGRIPNFHQSTKAVQIGGTSCFKNDGDDQETPRGPSADQIVAELLAGATRFPSLPLCVSPQNTPGFVDFHTLSFKKPSGKVDRWGRPVGQAIEPFISPTVLYQKLFGQPLPPGPDQLELARTMIKRRTSVLDAVNKKTSQLLARVGQEDRRQLERYFDQITGLEARIRTLDPAALATCKKPPAVTKDPAPARNGDTDADGYLIVTDDTVNWSNETLRGQIQADCIAAALTCDLTRVVSWHFGESQCVFSMFPINGARTEMHAAGHFNPGGSLENVADCFNWHVANIARLVKALQVPDIDGRRVIDNTVILMCFEGGVGRDPSRMDDEQLYLAGERTSHASENMVIVMAGGAGGLRCGQHISYNRFPATREWTDKDRHPAQAILTGMKAVGYTGGALGEVQGTLPEMFA